VVGDVVGKGIQAAAAMAQLRNALRVFALEGYKPATVLSRANRLARSTGFSFATLLYLVLDTDAATCRFASAGHLPPLVVEEGGSAWFVEGGRSLPIGVADDTEYRQEAFAVPSGATILLYTDGLVERRKESLDDGLERLRGVAARFGPEPEPLLETLIENMLPGGNPADDVALLAVHRLAVSSRSLRLRVPADPAELRVVRGRLRAWLASEGADREDAEEIVVAASEACANAIEHPRMPRQPFVEVEASAQNGVVSLVVRDFGRWRPAVATRNRGRGLAIIEALADHVERLESETGTELRFVRAVRNGQAR
jgi:anti-sigma regulatory factor (Ser/Thr protein kinase)